MADPAVPSGLPTPPPVGPPRPGAPHPGPPHPGPPPRLDPPLVPLPPVRSRRSVGCAVAAIVGVLLLVLAVAVMIAGGMLLSGR